LASPDGEQRGGWGGPSPPSLLVTSGGPARVEDGGWFNVEGLDGGGPRVELKVRAQVVVPVRCYRSTLVERRWQQRLSMA
jgi:hypothetical protein